jgi:class 3 adenylate cyclase
VTFYYDWRWHFDVAPAALWPLISNTNEFNRAARVPPVERIGTPGRNNRLKMRSGRYAMVLEWEEEPFEWVRPHTFSVTRAYYRGPVAASRVLIELSESNGGTDVRYQVWAEPRNLIARLLIPLHVGVLTRRGFHRVFQEYADLARNASNGNRSTNLDLQLQSEPAQLATGADERLKSIRQQLEGNGHSARVVDDLLRLIEFGEDTALIRIRPYLLADVWDADRRNVVEAVLSATRSGLLDLQWDVMCPMCRGSKATVEKLSHLPNTVHCDACRIEFDANFAQSVELTFRPNPSIREINVQPFCVGGPQVTPHIVVQQLVRAGETREVQPILEPGRYRVRALNLSETRFFHVAETGDPRPIDLKIPDVPDPNSERTITATPTLRLINESNDEQLIFVERTAWNDMALSAAAVTAMQSFRDLFSAEALRPGETVSVGSLAVLFTDLRNSTKLYRTIGDATAFGRVLRHFEILRAAVAPEDGAVVKTIGDAVMAVFRSPAGAVRAILRAQEALAHAPEGVQSPFLKAGIHFGPCIGVTLNDRLDYFGSTINVAARLDAHARGGEMVVSDVVRFDPEVEALIARGVLVAESFETELKGFDDLPFSLWRLSAVNRRFGQC